MMKRHGRRLVVTLAALAFASAATSVALAVTSSSSRGHSGPCHGVRVARSRRFGWWMHPGEQFSRAWVCGHFGAPRTVVGTQAGVLWRYGPPGRRGLTFVREPDGQFTPA
jgi:hypothetical protein